IGFIDPTVCKLCWVIGAILVLASVIAWILSYANRGKTSSTLKNLNQRIWAWWIMAFGLAITLLIGETAVIILFLLLSFLALLEFLTLAPTHRSDHEHLVCVYYVIIVCDYC